MNKNIKILVVNNNISDANTESFALTLENLKLQNITSVNNTKAAIAETVKANPEHQFEVTFIHDLQNGDEIELLKSLMEINPFSYVVMLTSDISADKVLNSIKHGASGILSKPFTDDKVRSELEKYSLLREDKREFYS